MRREIIIKRIIELEKNRVEKWSDAMNNTGNYDEINKLTYEVLKLNERISELKSLLTQTGDKQSDIHSMMEIIKKYMCKNQISEMEFLGLKVIHILE